jgi:branched-chain amino acid transport system substrate-binding protein
MVPSDVAQAQAMADYAYNILNYREIVIMYTSLDNYSVSLYSSFKKAFKQKGGTIVDQPYVEEDRASIQTALGNALASNPDAIYFSGFPDDVGPMLNLPQIATLPPDFKILGGDAMAALGNYPPNQQNLNRLAVTSWTAQDEWQFLQVQQLPFISTFTRSYRDTFESNTIGPNTMLVYDAANVFLHGYQRATVNKSTNTCVPCALQSTFQSMNGSQAWQGVTGQIAFANGSTEPANKVVLIEEIGNGVLKTVACRGRFLVSGSDCK